jgi:hypothetical protein
MPQFNGLGMSLGSLSRLSNAETRSISPENLTGEKGRGAMAKEGSASVAARDLGQGWKVNPYVVIEPGATFELANIAGQGAIQQIWMTLARGKWRFSILRAYWDDQEQPSIEAPTGDFFACGWESFAQVNSLPVCVNPGRAFNCYWEMPFRKRARFTMTNLSDEPLVVYYQINYTLTTVPEDCAYFHAQFRRTNPLPYKDVYTILDGVRGQGHYAGVYMAWGVNNSGWWGEGEIKFYLDATASSPPSPALARKTTSRRVQLRSASWSGASPDACATRSSRPRTRAAGDQARRPLPEPAALRHVPLAHHGPDPLQTGLARDPPGARLAFRRALPALAGRHRLDGVLVSGRAARALPHPAGPERVGSDLAVSLLDVQVSDMQLARVQSCHLAPSRCQERADHNP